MSKKRALVLIQGINTKSKYMKPKTKHVDLFLDQYDAVEYVNTEEIFDRGWFSKLFDKLDFIPYFVSDRRKKDVCRAVNAKVAELQILNYEVDILAHSLGCVIAMQSGRKSIPIQVNNFIALQSPVHNKVYGWFVRDKIREHSKYLHINNLYHTYNKKDKLVAHKKIKLKKYVKSLDAVIGKSAQLNVGDGHSWEKALIGLLNHRKDGENA